MSKLVPGGACYAHGGFSVDQSVFLPAGDSQGIERLVRYMTRCPFSLARLINVTETGHVVYKAEKSSSTCSLTLIKRFHEVDRIV